MPAPSVCAVASSVRLSVLRTVTVLLASEVPVIVTIVFVRGDPLAGVIMIGLSGDIASTTIPLFVPRE